MVGVMVLPFGRGLILCLGFFLFCGGFLGCIGGGLFFRVVFLGLFLLGGFLVG